MSDSAIEIGQPRGTPPRGHSYENEAGFDISPDCRNCRSPDSQQHKLIYRL